MAALTSKIILCKNIKMDRENINVLSYTESQMLTLVNSSGIKVVEKNNYSFIGKGDRSAINVDISYSTCLSCNYMAFQNTAYNNKWYFAFIDRVEYINDLTTRLYYTVDIFHTWLDYWSNKACYIVREHVNDDVLGNYTQDEGLALGTEYVIRQDIRDSKNDTTAFYIASTYNPETGVDDWGAVYNGVYSGFKYYEYPASAITGKIATIVNAVGASAIQCLFMAPTWLGGGQSGAVPSSLATKSYYLKVPQITQVAGITPKNKKCLCYPYCYIEMSNMCGATAVLKQEQFYQTDEYDNYVFVVDGAITPSCSVKLSPMYYNNMTVNVDEGIMLGKYPICNWAGDLYTNWLTQNGVNVFTGMVGGALNTGVGGSNKSATGIVGGIFDTISAFNEMRKASMVPPQVEGAIASGDVLTGMGENTFHIYLKTVKSETFKTIDDYFSKFGYKINKIKVANQTGRTNWNFVQIGANETIGYQKDNMLAVPPMDLININKLYQRGITIWHNHSTLGDYTQSNNVVS